MEPKRAVRTRVAVAGIPPGSYSWGSGYLISSQLVLTARHVLLTSEADDAEVAKDCDVLLFGDTEWAPAKLAWSDRAKDAAVVKVDGLPAGQDLVRWGRLEGAVPFTWTAVGFPHASIDEA